MTYFSSLSLVWTTVKVGQLRFLIPWFFDYIMLMWDKIPASPRFTVLRVTKAGQGLGMRLPQPWICLFISLIFSSVNISTKGVHRHRMYTPRVFCIPVPDLWFIILRMRTHAVAYTMLLYSRIQGYFMMDRWTHQLLSQIAHACKIPSQSYLNNQPGLWTFPSIHGLSWQPFSVS